VTPPWRATALVIVAAAAAPWAGCSYAGSFDDADPGSRLDAIRRAVAAGDRSAVPSLITLLDSDDAAVRLYSINALEHFTGQTLGYDHAAPPRDRRLAVERWVRWYRQQQQQQSQGPPAGAGDVARSAAGARPRRSAAVHG
jgi:HAMP domain-containing protein